MQVHLVEHFGLSKMVETGMVEGYVYLSISGKSLLKRGGESKSY
jgi:hypothetical protein